MSQQQATIERYKVNLGSLRSQIELKLLLSDNYLGRSSDNYLGRLI